MALSRYPARVIEIAWLAALLITPILMHTSAERVFELSNVALLRTFALLMLVAWIVGRLWSFASLSAGSAAPMLGLLGRLRRAFRDNPLALPALLLVASTTLSTAASVAPRTSLFGSYDRSQGLLTMLTYVGIFVLAAQVLRSRQQIDRAVSLLILVSFPVALYAIIQRYALDPRTLPASDTAARSTSTFGNAALLGGYLILSIPLTLTRLLMQSQDAATRLRRPSAHTVLRFAALGSALICAFAWSLSYDLGPKSIVVPGAQLTPSLLAVATASFAVALAINVLVVLVWGLVGRLCKRGGSLLPIGGYAFVLAAQITALWFSGSRGPMIGLFGACLVLVLLHALLRGRRRLAIGLACGAVILVVGVGLLGSGRLIAPNDARDPAVQRLLRTFSLEGGTTATVRAAIWTSAFQLVFPHPPLWSPTTHDDRLNMLRPLIGYGPDGLYSAFQQMYPAELGQVELRTAKLDRAHNVVLDALAQTGVAGALAYLLLFGTMCLLASTQLGLIVNRWRVVSLGLACGAIAAGLAGVVIGWQFTAAALSLGLLAGWLIDMLITGPMQAHDRGQADTPARAIQVALLATLIGHWIDVQVGFAGTATSLTVWSIAALLGANGRLLADPIPSNTSPTSDVQDLPTTPMIHIGMLGGLVLAALAFGIVDISVGGAGIADVLASFLFSMTTEGPRFAPGLLCVFGGTLALMVLIGAATIAPAIQPGRWGDWLLSLGVLVATALVIVSLWIVIQITTLRLGWPDALTAPAVRFPFFVVVALISVLIAGVFSDPALAHQAIHISLPTSAPHRRAYIGRSAFSILIALAAALFAAWTNSAPVATDVLYHQMRRDGSEPARLLERYKAMLAWQPAEDYTLAELGETFLSAAQATDVPAQRMLLLEQSRAALLQARELNPLNSDHTHRLAQLEMLWAGLADDRAEQRAHRQQAFVFYEQAIQLNPHAAYLYDEYAEAVLDSVGAVDPSADTATATQPIRTAKELINRALALDPTFCLTFALRARLQPAWQDAAHDSIQALALLPRCRGEQDLFASHARTVALQGLAHAGDQARAAGVGALFAQLLGRAADQQRELDLYLALTSYQVGQGDINAALHVLETASTVGIDNQIAHQQALDMYRSLSQLHDAIAAVTQMPEDPFRHQQLAELWLALGQPNRALIEYQTALGYRPTEYQLQRNVALLFIQVGTPAEAQHAALKAYHLAPFAEQSFWKELTQSLEDVMLGQVMRAEHHIAALKQQSAADDQLAQSAIRALQKLTEQ